ncbi:MAG: hypothetical protein OHK0011_00440 [Turneriella sp.]
MKTSLFFPLRFRLQLLFLFLLPPLFADDLQLETKIPLGLAHDGQILWISDAQTRQLTGYDVAQKKRLATRTLSFDIRDLAFWAPNLVTVAPNYVFVINPINGDLVDKIPLKGISDPVAIALDMHQAYIYNREDKKIYRVHLVDRMQFGSFTPEVSSDLRSMTFYKGFLWAVSRDGKAYKLSPADGAQISFLPLPEGCYGISFVDGGMYVARPGQVRSVDFIETESYVAAARRNFTLAAELQIDLPWSEEERSREARLLLKYSLLPVTAHQRIAGLRADPFIRFGRWEDGSHTAEVALEPKSSDKQKKHKLQFQATLYNLTHIFSAQLIKQYFRNPELPESVRPYLDPLPLDAGRAAAIETFRKGWLKRNDGKHPIYAIAALKADKVMDDDSRCGAMRSLGVPCRKMVFFDLDSKKNMTRLQVYIQPTGWVTISDRYDSAKPKEFPVANNELELFSPDDISMLPRVRRPAGAVVAPNAADLLQFLNFQVITSTTE